MKRGNWKSRKSRKRDIHRGESDKTIAKKTLRAPDYAPLSKALNMIASKMGRQK